MASVRQHPPVILLLAKRTRDTEPLDTWLEESRYSVLEAMDAFHALEQVSDFTLRDRPDVVFLHVNSTAVDLKFMETLVAAGVGEPAVPIIDFASEGESSREGTDFEKTIAGLACELDRFIPQHGAAGV